MTINDLPLNERCHKIRAIATLLQIHVSNGLEKLVFADLMQIEQLAKEAQDRLNELRPKEKLPDGYQTENKRSQIEKDA